MSNRHSYFFRRLLVTAAAVAAPLLLLNAYTLWAQRAGDLAAATSALQARADRVAREADIAVSRVERLLAFLASRPELRAHDARQCAALLNGLTAVDPLLANVGAVDLQGRPLCRAVDGANAYASYADVAWFRGALASAGPYFSAPYVGEISRRWLVNVVHPLHGVDGQRIALLAAAIDIGAVVDNVLTTEGLPDGSFVALAAPDSTIVAVSRARGDWIGRKAPVALFGRLEAATGPIEATGVDGVARFYAVTPMRSFGIRAGAAAPVAAVKAESDRSLRRSVAGSIAVAIAALLVALFGARRLSRPVSALVRTTQQFASGDLEARADEKLPGEFGNLAVEFNRGLAAYAASTDARRAQAAAEAASHAKSQFLANMSHEIRTPMNAILGMTDLTLRTELQPKQREYLTRVRTAAGSLLAIISDILDFSKIEAGKLELEQTDFLLQDVLDRVTSVVGVRAHEKGLELLTAVAADVPAAVHGDPLRLEQVLLNLCSNAVKFTARGEIVVDVARDGPDGAGDVVLRFSVRDSGAGMREAQLATLFSPFAQGDASTTRRHGGTGLGLAISKQLVALMGGAFRVRSAPGKGSDFTFTAAFAVAREGAAGAAAVSAVVPARAVLLVDDSASARAILGTLVERLGGHATCVADADAALAAIAGRRFDLALVDRSLSGADGIALARRLAAEGAGRVLLLTPYGDEDGERQAAEQGLAGCLSKPVRPLALREALAGLAPARAPARPTEAVPPSLRGKRVLLVEDNEVNRMVATELLTSVAGVRIEVAGTGAQAVAATRAQRFDAVLMDVQMPEMDGWRATALIRAQPANADLPVIAMTAHALASDRAKCLAAGMDDYITKPFEPERLFAVLARWTGGAGAAGEAARMPAGAEPPRGVDVARGLHRCLGRSDLYRRIAARFVETRARDAADLRAAVAGGDLERARHLAHSVTSSAGIVGADRLSAIAIALQDALADGAGPAALQALVAGFAEEHAVVTAELRAWLGQQTGAAVPAG